MFNRMQTWFKIVATHSVDFAEFITDCINAKIVQMGDDEIFLHLTSMELDMYQSNYR